MLKTKEEKGVVVHEAGCGTTMPKVAWIDPKSALDWISDIKKINSDNVWMREVFIPLSELDERQLIGLIKGELLDLKKIDYEVVDRESGLYLTGIEVVETFASWWSEERGVAEAALLLRELSSQEVEGA